MRPELARKASARGRRLAKRPCDVQQAGGVFPAPSRGPKCRKKLPESGGFCRRFEPCKGTKPPEPGGLLWLSKFASEASRLEPFGVAAATIAARTAISIATAIPIATAIHAGF